jgi:two-component system sensor histidine kinase ArlS
MNMRLLDKTLRIYVILSLLVMAICAPLFYFVSNRLFIESADETLIVRKKDFIENVLPTLKIEDVTDWNKISRDVKIEEPMPTLRKDSIFFHVYYNKFEDENENHRVLLSPVTIEGRPYAFFARVNLIESEDLISNIALLFCTILFLLLAGLYFISRRVSKRIWLPFYATLNQIEQFDLDKNEKANFEPTTVEEFSRLNQSIERLVERNLLNYKNQKEFVENAAHELQTPLAIIQAKLDVLTQQVPMTNELGNTLSELNKTVSMLNRVNKNLLLLSKIETYKYNTTERVLVSETVKRQVLFLKEQAEEKKIIVHVMSTESVVLDANASLIEILISNVLLNSLRHNYAGGEIWITLNQREFAISNTSKQTELQREKLFQRFSNAGTEGGNGLGLSIVKKICDLHGWNLNYNYLEEKHLFQVVF